MSVTPQLSAPAPAKARNITRADLDGRESLLEKARRLETESRQVRKLIAAIDDDIMRFVLEREPKQRTLVRSGYRLSIQAVRKGVSWATEFAKRLGLAEKERVTAAAPYVDKLSVEKV